ncbi:MAG: AMP-binding protein [Burkholderiaceae bacterium]|nr:AMP-binding protein [Burkholderiaceae bacterium]
MTRLPLVGHTRPDQIVAWHRDRAITLAHFLSDVNHLANQLPERQYLFNMCTDRYRFTVGLAAAVLTGKVSLLPSTHTPEMVRQMQAFAPDVFCLHDTSHCSIALPQLRYPELPEFHTLSGSDCTVPVIDREQLIAIVFTSGSTGTPVPHHKYWGPVLQSVQSEAGRIGLSDHATACTVVGTVPAQHMYGFESTVLIALQSGHALSGALPFYPADIVTALEAVPVPRILVSTPVHLRMLLESGLELPDVTLVLSATAPLSLQLAHDVEARFNAPLQEIYGSTETGTIAARRPTQTMEWRLFDGVEFSQQGDQTTASGGHVMQPIIMNDVIELTQDHCFLLHGRKADMINIAGKRSSLAHLNHLLNSIPGVLDGAFYMPDEESHDHVVRLVACVVAPTMTAQLLMTALREHIDAVFLPRPLLLVSALPRNSTGKLPRDALATMIQALLDNQA